MSGANRLSDRAIRQREIVPPEKLAACRAVVIGVGAIGRQVAVQLAAVGIPAMDLVDFDIVNVENLAPQAYWPTDLGQPKVQATAALCRAINPEIEMGIHIERFRRSSARTLLVPDADNRKPVVFACVDSMEARQLVWDVSRERVGFFVDGRMSAEVLRVLASGNPATDNAYAATLFPQSEAVTGSCTAKSTVYTASIAAGMMVSQFTRWLRGMPVEGDVLLNLLSMEVTVA